MPWQMRRTMSSTGAERSRLGVGRQQADQEGRRAHQADGDEERALAAELVADDAEDQRAERAKAKPTANSAERGDQRGRRIEAGEKDLGDDRRQAAEDEEVVPFEGRAADDAMMIRAIDPRLCSCCSTALATLSIPSASLTG